VWDNPRLANAAANALYALALALITYAGALVLAESPAFSLKTIVVGGELRHVARDEIVGAYPLGRVGEVEDIVATALFLATKDGDFFTGQTLCPAGGDVMV